MAGGPGPDVPIIRKGTIVVGTQQQTLARCTLCPAGCELALVQAGPDNWRSEYPAESGRGLCPRGSALGELLSHRQRLLAVARREGGQLHALDLPSALRRILDAAAGRKLVLLLDGNVPVEQMTAAAAWCRDWPLAELCLVVELAEEQLLLGTEASGADYLSDDDLKDCDGFVVIGDVFGANPLCSRGLFDRRRSDPRTPIVTIDPAAGSAAKFGTHRVVAGPGGEPAALHALAAAAGVESGMAASPPAEGIPSAAEAGSAIAGCKRLAVLIVAEHGRGCNWRQVGFAAATLAKALGGGVAAQTAGANALAAVRLAAELGTISLAKALSDESAVRVAIGCDVLGMLGQPDIRVFATAAPLPNCTTDAAEIILPLAMAGEYGGTYLLTGAKQARIAPLMSPPAGVPSPAQLVEALASAAGIAQPQTRPQAPKLERLSGQPPSPAPAQADSPGTKLLLERQAIHAGCGALTAHGSWQAAIQPLPELRICPRDAREAHIKNLAVVTVRAGGQSVRAAARLAPELAPGTVVLPEGSAQARALIGARIDPDNDAVVAEPVPVDVSP